MNRLSRGFFILAVLATPALAADIPTRDAYGYGFPISTDGDFEFFSAEVPIAVYRSVADPRMRDAGVYNAVGQPVPRMFEHPVVDDTDTEQQVSLGLVPLFGDQADETDQLRLLLRRDADGTILELDAPKQPAQSDSIVNAGKPLAAYILDARELDQRLEALEFRWPQQSQGFIGSVTVEDSDDLRKWRKLGSATLADLSYEQTRIGQNRIALARDPADFLRITWRDMPDAWSLDAVSGIYTLSGAPALREWLTLDPGQDTESEREFVFDLGGYPPADRVKVLLPDENVVVRASIFYRGNGEERWRAAANGIFYNIDRQGNALQSPAAEVNDVRARHWMIRVESGATNGTVKLQLGWRPDRLVFVAQGSGPYELVTGRAEDRLEQFPHQAVLGDRAIFSMLRDSGEAGMAFLGTRIDIAGDARLSIAPTTRLRTVLLWLGLSGAILLVGWLVWSLARDMRQGEN